MTDHAAEAHKRITELQKTGKPETYTEHALEVIAHTLQAILTALADAPGTRCTAQRWIPTLSTDTQCIHNRAHTGNHQGDRGHQW